MALLYFYTLTSVLIVSLLSLVGIFSLLISQKKLDQIILLLVSLSAGTLLGDSFLHLIPEAVEKSANNFIIWLWLLSGLLTFFILEKIIHWRHCHIITTGNHPHPVGMMNLIGDVLHNLTDGMIIAGSFLVDFRLGIATTIAVITHEIPQEIGDFGILIYAGYTKIKALFFNFLSALAAFIGALLTLIIGFQSELFSNFIISFTAGGFIYIATSDLIPELRKDTKISKTIFQLLGIVFGIGIMLLLKKFF